MSAEARIAEVQIRAAERRDQEEAQKLANEAATNDVAESLMDSKEVREADILKAIADYQKANPSVMVTLSGVKEILEAFDINVIAAEVSEEVAEVVRNPLQDAAKQILSILRDNIETDITPRAWLDKSSAQIIRVLTENRRGKSALSATGVWNQMIKENTAFAARNDLKQLFIERFSNLRTK